MTEKEMLALLKEIEEGRNDLTSESHEKYWGKMHALAEAQFVPAIAFFRTCLDDTRADWREDCLTSLGFHYIFPADSEIATRIRQLLLADQDSNVRLAAASVLGSRSQSADPALIAALQSDDDEDVRYAAFSALLKLAGVPLEKKWKEVERAKQGEILPSLEEIARIQIESQLE